MTQRSRPFVPAPIPAFEHERLADVSILRILDTVAEERFDRFTRLTADLFEVPITMVSLIDHDRQWFKSVSGLPVQQIPRDLSFCSYTILEPESLIVPDTEADHRFRSHPMVQGDPGIRFYAGAVLRGPSRQPVGTLCLLDSKPRHFGERDRQRLLQFGQMVEHELHYTHQIDAMRKQVELAAYYDPLTGLPNRRLVHERLQQSIRLGVGRDQMLVVLFADIDRFSTLNRTLGRASGDAVLQEAGRRLRATCDPHWTVGRWQDDQFVVIAPVGAGYAHLAHIILETFQAPFHCQGVEYPLSAHLGASSFPGDGDDAEALTEKAGAALAAIRSQPAPAFRFYTRDIDRHLARRFDLEGRLRHAIDLGQLHVVYQPKVSLAGGQICGMEALLRWTDPELGPVAPAEFIPIAEQSGLIIPLGDWVMRTACAQAQQWRTDGLAPLSLAVNVSSRQLRQRDFGRWLQTVLQETGLDPATLNLEITESTLIDDIEDTIQTMQEVAALGPRFSIDDFGTGYSSLNYLKRLPVHTFKVDKCFVDEMTSNAHDATITHAIIAMAHSLHLDVVAEGVENHEQLVFLRAYHCDEIQGYLFSGPLSAEEFADWVRSGRRLAC